MTILNQTISAESVAAMKTSARFSEIALIIGFLTIIFSVPITQSLSELRRGERVQFTDVFRYGPTEGNLRQYEKTLEDKSIFQRATRPWMQQLEFRVLNEPGAKAIMGKPGWVFYRPDVRYLIEPDSLESGDRNSAWLPAPSTNTICDSVVRAILEFRRQLAQRNIELLVVPVPGKPSMYADKLPYVSAERSVNSPTRLLIGELQMQNIPVVDLFSLFQKLRQSQSSPLYLQTDTHWTPQGAEFAARAVADRIRELSLPPGASREYLTRPIKVARSGDILEMTQIPNIQSHFPAEIVECEQVIDRKTGLLIPTAGDRPGSFRHPSQQSQILVLGDSFCRIYQMPEPRSLGQVLGQGPTTRPDEKTARRPLPGSAGFISHLALQLRCPIDYIVSDGGASTDVRQKLSTNAQLLAGKKLVIWEFVERDIRLGKSGWQDIPLPAQLDN